MSGPGVSVVLFFFVVTLVAAYMPIRLDPAVALRCE
jgi:hypothetical protein